MRLRWSRPFVSFLLCLASFATSGAVCGADRPPAALPNIVFIIADDLGRGDLGCYGQQKIRTPNIDRIAAEGMRFTSSYSGHNVCAPSRCVLMTGMHPGHAYIRDNHQAKGFPEGQEPVPAGELRLPRLFKQAGYAVGGFGKWGLGPMGSTGDPLRQGFDRWFGYNCQAVAHNHYPQSLWDNDKPLALNNPKFAAYQKLPPDADPTAPESYVAYAGRDYAPDLIGAQALEFIRSHHNRPFFLYFATTIPHLALQVPQDSLAEYAGQFADVPYVGDRGYLPHRQPRAAYAAMITRMDRDVGRLTALIHELGLDDRTIIVFTSDNGPLYDRHGGTDADFFNSAAGLRGRKGSYYEGGFRAPCLVRWPGRIAAGSVSDRVTGFEDWLPTLLDLVGRPEATPGDIDGLSFAPTLLGQAQPARAFLYRESPSYGGQQCLRAGDWKVLRRNLNPNPKAKDQQPTPIELYNLAADPAETTNVAHLHPAIVDRLTALMDQQHRRSEVFPIRTLDAAASRE